VGGEKKGKPKKEKLKEKKNIPANKMEKSDTSQTEAGEKKPLH
jgi:hypothetical protein